MLYICKYKYFDDDELTQLRRKLQNASLAVFRMTQFRLTGPDELAVHEVTPTATPPSPKAKMQRLTRRNVYVAAGFLLAYMAWLVVSIAAYIDTKKLHADFMYWIVEEKMSMRSKANASSERGDPATSTMRPPLGITNIALITTSIRKKTNKPKNTTPVKKSKFWPIRTITVIVAARIPRAKEMQRIHRVAEVEPIVNQETKSSLKILESFREDLRERGWVVKLYED
ncbi:hypothetical protein TELCIR_04746 [Teladorsagia circumcincta]|uniref:Uncharacterized protein n=1 Tax=Teladorsagia circumcincta TaxID=45464 RepID=A0A2G9USQ2_TELCI|nr:hypothetical protein TELCIR_04746 [Teladorsagia circumcincta]